MKTTARRVFALLLAMVLLTSLLPKALVSAFAEGAASAGPEPAPTVPLRALTPVQSQNAEAACALLAQGGAQARDGDFEWRLLGDGTVAIVGYVGDASDVTVPRTVAGAPVVAIDAGVFGEGVRRLTVHGNVFYIADGAVSPAAEVCAWQGSYAAAWAQRNARAFESLTEGVLREGAVDMSDAADGVRVLSESMVAAGEVEARRLPEGTLFTMRTGAGEERFFAVTARRLVNGRAYLTVRAAELTDVYSYRLFEGTKTFTHTASSYSEVGVDLSDEQIAALTVLDHKPMTEEKIWPVIHGASGGIFKKAKLNMTFEIKTELTSSYRVQVDGDTITEGTLASDQKDTYTLTVSLAYKDKLWEVDNGAIKSVLCELSDEELDDFLDALSEARSAEKKEKLDSYIFVIEPTLGLSVEVSPSFGVEMGGSGSISWSERTLSTSEWVPRKKEWGSKKVSETEHGDPEISGAVYAKGKAGVSVKLCCAYALSPLQISISRALKLSLDIPLTDRNACTTLTWKATTEIEIEAGLWLTAGKWEVQLLSAKKVTISAPSVSKQFFHINRDQGLHLADHCEYTPPDYSIRFITGTEWRPKNICFLKDGTYLWSPVEVKIWSVEVSSTSFKKQEDLTSTNNVKRINYSYKNHPEAIDETVTLPHSKSKKSRECCEWALVEPEPQGDEYIWKDYLTVRENLEEATGKAIAKQEDVPSTITLQAIWANKHTVTYDPNGGCFSSGIGTTGGKVYKYYVPGDKCKPIKAVPTRQLALFRGWATDPLGEEFWYGTDDLQEDLYLYAIYEVLDPTDHETVNTQFGRSATLIGTDATADMEALDWKLEFADGSPMSADVMEAILQDGIDAYLQSPEYLVVAAQHGGIRYDDALRDFKGSVVSIEDEVIGVMLNGLVDPDKTYDELILPGTINNVTAAPECDLLQNVKAKKVYFAASGVEDVVFAEVDEGLFEGNTTVEEVYMDATGIVRLSNRAFFGCENLKCVTLPDTLQVIGAEAFDSCGNLGPKLVLGRQVDTLGKNAFRNCLSLAEVSISTPYLTAAKQAFPLDNSNVEDSYIDMTIEDTVIELPKDAFRECEALKSLTVVDHARLTTISEYAFYECGLYEIKLNEGLLKIGRAAFAWNPIEEAVIPESVESFYDGNEDGGYTYSWNVFYATPLTKITIGGEAMPKVTRGMFMNATNGLSWGLVTVVLREGVEEIDDHTFDDCDGLRYVALPSTLTTIGNRCFSLDRHLCRVGPDPDNMEDGTVELPASVKTIGFSAFYGCEQITDVSIPGAVQRLERATFCKCTNLRHVALPDGLRSIDKKVFAETAIEDIEIPQTVEKIYVGEETDDYSYSSSNNIFYNTPLKRIVIGGDALNTVQREMLCIDSKGKTGLQEIVLREGVTDIADGAFQDMDQLEYATLPSSLKRIGYDAFSEAYNLKAVGLDPHDLPEGSMVLPDGVESIGVYAFGDCYSLTSVSVPESVESIGTGAFGGCSQLEDIELNEGLREIGVCAFSNTNIEEITIPESVENIVCDENYSYAHSLFSGINSLRKITIGSEALSRIDDTIFDENKVMYSVLESVELREGVTEIGDNVLASLKYLERVTLPSTLTTIGEGCFSGDTALKRVGVNADALADGSLSLPNGIRSIGRSAFADCPALTDASIPASLVDVPECAFAGCSGLKTVTLGEGLRTIGRCAFAGTAIEEIVIPTSLTSFCTGETVADHAFYNAPLKKMTVGSAAMPALTAGMFVNRDAADDVVLEEVMLREGVTALDAGTFAGLRHLLSVVLPRALTAIGDNCFAGDAALATVMTGPALNRIGSAAFDGAQPGFYALPGTAYNAWLANWCAQNGFTYDADHVPAVTVRFDDGLPDTEAIPPQTVDAFSRIVEPPTPECAGMGFLGWYAPGYDVPWDFEKDYVSLSDLTLKARWASESPNGIYRVDNGKATLLAYALADGESTALVIPSVWHGWPVTAVADGAFADARIAAVTLPAGIESLSPETFAGAEGLVRIAIQGEGSGYATRDGMLYNADLTELLYCPAGRRVATLVIPDGVTAIGANAFNGNGALREIQFNAALTDIGAGAFRNCSGLTGLELPDSLLRIGENAFRNCGGLLKVSGALDCSRIGGNAFTGTGSCVFYGAENSALIQYAKANQRFYNLYTATWMVGGEAVDIARVQAGRTVPYPDPDLEVDGGYVAPSVWYADAEMTDPWDYGADVMPAADLALYGSLQALFETEGYYDSWDDDPYTAKRIIGYHGDRMEITIPEELNHGPVYALNADAFPEGCTLQLPGCLEEIDVAAFTARNIKLYAPKGSDTERLLSDQGYVQQPRPHTLSFEPNGGRLIDPMTVMSGETVCLPGTVRGEDEYPAWYRDELLNDYAGGVDSLFVMPDEDVTLYASWPSDAPDYDFLWAQSGKEIVITGSRQRERVTIPETVNGLPVTEIAAEAFMGDRSLQSVALPDGLLSVGASAFRGSGLYSVQLPAGVAAVGEYAFADCADMQSFTCAPLAELPAGMLSGNAELCELILPEGIEHIGAGALAGCVNLKRLDLPESLTDIGDRAFQNMRCLATLTLGGNVRSVAGSATEGCAALQAFEVSADNTDYTCRDGVLYYADLSGVARYPAGATRASYAVDENAMMIGDYAFEGAKRLKQVVLPDRIAQLGKAAFAGSGLSGIDLSALSGLSEIPENAFSRCQALVEATLPEGLTAIRTGAFNRCALETLDIPDAVYVIESDAFHSAMTLVVGEGSAAEFYAVENGLPYRLRGAQPVHATSVTSEKDALTLNVGVGYTLPVEVHPEGAIDAVQWYAEDAEILFVEDGFIWPAKVGETTLTVAAGDARLTIPVRVTDAAFEITAPMDFALRGCPIQLSLRSTCDNDVGYVSGVRWSCEGASITSNGLLSAKETGTARVIAKLPGGGMADRTFTCYGADEILSLPAFLTCVEEEAFMDAATLKFVLIPDSVTAIKDRAFAGCDGLRAVVIPASVKAISQSAFDENAPVVIVCPEGSDAEAYAITRGLSHVALP